MDSLAELDTRVYSWYLQCSRFLVLFLVLSFVAGPSWLFGAAAASTLCVQLCMLAYGLVLRLSSPATAPVLLDVCVQ